MAKARGTLIFERKFRAYSIFVLVGTLAMGGVIALHDGDPFIGMQVGLTGFCIMVPVLAIAASLAGRSQLALLRLEGETLVVRPVHFLDLGRERRLPLRETSEWWLRVGGYKRQRYKDVAFRHGGKTWRFYLFEPDWSALEPLEALVTETFGAGWQEAFDDPEAHYAGREKRDLSA